jgi:starch phosphorylase
MARLTPRFSTNRAVREYTEQRYLPAAAAYRERAAEKGAAGRNIIEWKHSLKEKWASLHFGEVKIETREERYIFEVQVCLSNLDPTAVRVELYADGIMGGVPVHQEMKRGRRLAGTSGDYAYGATVSAARPAADYTARVIPNCEGVAVPLEAGPILWQR